MSVEISTPIVKPFTQQQEGEDIIIGNPVTGVFLALPKEAVELLEELAEGKSVERVADDYERKYGEKPDIDDLLAVLEVKGFLQSPESDPNVNEAPRQSPRLRYHFGNFPQRIAKILFSRSVLAGCLILVCSAIGALIYDPKLAPGPQALFFPDHRALTLTALLVLNLLTVFFHELAHLVAARAAGVSSRMGISTRLWDLVAETDLTGLWAIPKTQRYLPMLAGMLVDAVSGSLLVLMLLARDQHWVALSAMSLRLSSALLFGYFMRIAWEFLLFVRTDIYYVVAAFFSCKNLLTDTQVFLRNRLASYLSSVAVIDQSAIPAREMKAIRGYAWVWLCGRLGAFAMLFWVTVPLTISYANDLSRVFRKGYSADPANFLDGTTAAVFFLVPTISGFLLGARGLFSRRRSRT